ncbi:MAG: hypothetical protein HW391_47 [Chloroflexi bacterium]|nr:hypothetical protein [Chloroflexota bacterium]
MDSLLPILAGSISLLGAFGILRSFGPRYRVGRLLGVAPRVSIGEAIELSRSGRAAYVRIEGRVDSEAEFEDADHRPLVFRQTRLQSREEGRWKDFEVVREIVPFELREGLDGIAIDGQALTDGLVVVPRETIGVIGDLGDRAPDDLPDDRPARVLVEHVSSVEHAIALGVPTIDAAGVPHLGPGLGRPLVLSTLEPAEAMRILVGGSSTRPRVAAALLLAGVVLVLVGVALLITPGDVLAASPSPSPLTGTDTRSAGEGPGFVGAILPAFLAVIGVAVLAIGLTSAFVRATGGPVRHGPSQSGAAEKGARPRR